ncbi:hypothetical protein [Rhodococcus sp. NPDC049939]|uniref:hypothetical protein n=1 Tax=Rhodococcus sp. NPDC049939 TaxID=3155511 RepID=UPI0033D75394
MKSLLLKTVAVGGIGLAAGGISAGVATAAPAYPSVPNVHPGPQDRGFEQLYSRFPQFEGPLRDFHRHFPQVSVPESTFGSS